MFTAVQQTIDIIDYLLSYVCFQSVRVPTGKKELKIKKGQKNLYRKSPYSLVHYNYLVKRPTVLQTWRKDLETHILNNRNARFLQS